jgi:alpha-tubulin suppressor-like RCC1 family protein
LGDGTVTNRNAPARIGNDTNWVAVSAGYHYTVALKSDGSLWTWGENTYGQLGDGTNASRNAPIKIGTNDWSTILAGKNGFHTIATKTDYSVWGWGYNYYGQLGDSTNASSNAPIFIGNGAIWAARAPMGMAPNKALPSLPVKSHEYLKLAPLPSKLHKQGSWAGKLR